MQDTSEKMQNLYHSLLMKKSGQERLLMGFSMFESARKLIMASFP